MAKRHRKNRAGGDQSFKKYIRYGTNLGTTILSQSISALSIFLLTPVFVDQMGAGEFGRYGVLLSIILFTSIIDFGLNIGMLRKLIHNPGMASGLISTLFFFFFALGIFCVPVFYLLYSKRILDVGDNYLPNAILTSILVAQNIFALLFDGILQTANKIFIGKSIRIVKLLLEAAVLYYLSSRKSATFLMAGSAVVNIFYLAALYICSHREVRYKISVKDFSIAGLAKHISYSSWYFLAAFATVLVFNAQILVLNSVAGVLLVARYIMVTRFYDIIRIGLTNFAQVLFPRVIQIESSRDWRGIKTIFKNTLFRVSILCVIVLLLALTIGQKIFLLWSGQHDAEIVTLYKVYSVFIMLVVLDNVSVVFLSALRMNKLPTLISICQGFAGLLLSYLLLPRFGIIGIALGSLTAFVFTNMAFNTFYLLRRVDEKIRTTDHQQPELVSSLP